MSDIKELRNAYQSTVWPETKAVKGFRYKKYLTFTDSNNESFQIVEQPYKKLMNDKKLMILEHNVTDHSVQLVYQSIKTGVQGVATFNGLIFDKDGKRI